MEVIQEDLFVLLERLQGEKDAAVKMINKSKATALHAGALAVLRAQENAVDLESSSTETSSPRPLTKSVFREKDDRDRFIQFIKGSMQPLKECAIVGQTMLDTLKVAQEKEVAMYMEKMQSLAQKQRMDLHLLEVTGRKENQLQQIKELEEEKYLQCQIESMILHKQQLAARHEKALQRMTADQKQKLQALSTRMQLATVKACKDIDKKVKTEEECVYAEHYVNVRGLKHMEKKLVHTLTNRQDTLVRNAQKHYEGSNAAPQMIIASLEKEIKVLLGRIELQQQKAQEIHAGNERMKRTLVSREAEIARTQDLIGRAEEVRAMVKRVQADLRATTGRIREVVWKTCVKEDTLKKMQVERTKFLAAMTENVRAVQQRRASLSADLELASMAVFVRLQEEEERAKALKEALAADQEEQMELRRAEDDAEAARAALSDLRVLQMHMHTQTQIPAQHQHPPHQHQHSFSTDARDAQEEDGQLYSRVFVGNDDNNNVYDSALVHNDVTHTSAGERLREPDDAKVTEGLEPSREDSVVEAEGAGSSSSLSPPNYETTMPEREREGAGSVMSRFVGTSHGDKGEKIILATVEPYVFEGGVPHLHLHGPYSTASAPNRSSRGPPLFKTIAPSLEAIAAATQ